MEAHVNITKSDLWPAGMNAECACPHCGHVDKHRIINVRSWGLDARHGECSACFCCYTVVAESAVIKAEKLPRDAQTFLIHHHYDIGDQGVTVKAPAGFAAALVTFYGCKHAAKTRFGESIDMCADREALCCGGKATDLLTDLSLVREGLRGFLAPHVDG